MTARKTKVPVKKKAPGPKAAKPASKPAAKAPAPKPPPAAPEEEPSGGSLAENPELEAALREAEQAVEKREREAKAAAETPPQEEELSEEEVLLSEEVETEFIEEEAERLRSELTETKDQLLRLQADFENFRRRALRDRHEALQYGHQNLVKDLLSVVDNLDRAVGHAQQSGGDDLEGLLHGVELVRREFLGALDNHGVREIDAMGKPFDPAVHEAMGHVPHASAAPNTVVEVLQKGYQIGDRLVRPSRVVVAREPGGAESGDGGEGGATD